MNENMKLSETYTSQTNKKKEENIIKERLYC
jgi:hypothetical protein